MRRFDGIAGRVAFVSGAGRGIGRAIAERLAAEGARVCVNDVDTASADVVASTIDGLAVPFDVSDRAAVREGIDRCAQLLGPVELLVANHGHMTMAAFTEQSDADLVRMFDVNLLGTAWLMQACVPAMAEAGYGRIVAIASECGVTGCPRASAYAGSKGAIIALAKSIAQQFASAGVAINSVAPGAVDTEQLEVDAIDSGLTRDRMVAAYASRIPLGRVARTDEIAATVAFLLSTPAIAFVGHVISPNGGSTRA